MLGWRPGAEALVSVCSLFRGMNAPAPSVETGYGACSSVAAATAMDGAQGLLGTAGGMGTWAQGEKIAVLPWFSS